MVSIEQFIADELGISVSDIKPESSLRLLCVDSLEVVYLVQELEVKFGVNLADDQIQKCNTISELKKLLVIH